jgi:hypothetical protein
MLLSDSLLAIAVALVLVGSCSMLSLEKDLDRLVQISVNELESPEPGQEYVLQLSVNNQSAEDIRIVGLTWC